MDVPDAVIIKGDSICKYQITTGAFNDTAITKLIGIMC